MEYLKDDIQSDDPIDNGREYLLSSEDSILDKHILTAADIAEGDY